MFCGAVISTGSSFLAHIGAKIIKIVAGKKDAFGPSVFFALSWQVNNITIRINVTQQNRQ